MTISQKVLLAVAATAFAVHSGGTYMFSLHGPLDALGQPAGNESKTLEFGGRHKWPGTVLSRNHIPATDIIWSFLAAHPKKAVGSEQ